MRRVFFLSFLLAACGTGETDGNKTAARQSSEAAGQTAELTGLYETAGERPSQLCVIGQDGGAARFGLVVWGGNDHSCSGSGQIVRDGDVLRLAMDGDEACEIEARIEGGAVTFPATVPEGCAYYCGARAQMAEISFEKTGGTAEDAMRAADLVGDPLCG